MPRPDPVESLERLAKELDLAARRISKRVRPVEDAKGLLCPEAIKLRGRRQAMRRAADAVRAELAELKGPVVS